MAQTLNDRLVRELTAPEKGNRINYDGTLKGFGVRVTAKGAKAFVLNYRTKAGQERRYTIGSFPDWKTTAAREEAERLKRSIDQGGDPVGEQAALREAPTVADMCQRFIEEHLPKKRPSTQRDYAKMIASRILPTLGRKKVVDIEFADIDALHRKISKSAPYVANRCIAILSKMFSLSIKWGWRPDNPAKGIERNQELKRHRYLSGEELVRLTEALNGFEDEQAANIVRLLLLTGARKSEVLSMRWAQLDLAAGTWTKEASETKAKRFHSVPLSAPARQLLAELRAKAAEDAEFVFPGRFDGRREDIKAAWPKILRAAGINGLRIHDLRHSYASMLVSSGLSLPVIGALLGHSQPATTARYAHLMDDPLREATERVGAIVTGRPSAEIVTLNRGGRDGR